MGRHWWFVLVLAPNCRFPAFFIQASIQQYRIFDQGG